jgi:regulation of enolase protein 1 (concanavalin A-like superfamily)
MTTGTVAPYRPDLRAGRDGFAQLLQAEWTKFRTVRGWVIGMILAALLPVAFGLLNHSSECGIGNPNGTSTGCPAAPVGPGGEAVTDNFYFVHQPLAGNGSITVRVTSLTGLYSSGNGQAVQSQAGMKPGLQPWSKAGIIIKENTRQGSAYAAMVVTGSHGVRMQYDYTQDTAGLAGAVSAASPRWLRLTRSGDTITGYDSADSTHWTQVGTAHLAGLSTTVQAGVFATSPGVTTVTSQSLTGGSGGGGPSLATASVDHVSLGGTWPRGTWTGADISSSGEGDATGDASLGAGFHQAGGGLSVSGTGDIAPDVGGDAGTAGAGGGTPIERTLDGAFAGLIAVIVVGAMFMTAEYRRGLIRVTLTASPRRGRVMVAKAIVIGAVTFVAGLVGAAIELPFQVRRLREGGVQILPVTTLTELRVIAGTAALLAVASVLALAVGALLRRSAGAVTAVIVGIVLAYLLAITALPLGLADWVLRVTPAAAFAIQQSIPQYSQVSGSYTPANGYFPLAPLVGFAVLCVWAAIALGLAVVLLRRRDA